MSQTEAQLKMQQEINLLIRGTITLRERLEVIEGASIDVQIRMCALEEVARAAGAIRTKINGQLQMLNVEYWVGPELRRLDAALKPLEE
jgi:hypothetical protein